MKNLGKIIKCRRCEEEQARITLEEGRYMVSCACCEDRSYLKEYQND